MSLRYALALAIAGLASPALAAADVSLGLDLTGDAEIKTVNYICENHDPVTVRYINAAPNFLALVPVNEATLVFVNTISASGAKYESGSFIWWNKGTDATLSDVTEGLDAAPVLTCSENIETP